MISPPDAMLMNIFKASIYAGEWAGTKSLH
jgi:hypothetical protein